MKKKDSRQRLAILMAKCFECKTSSKDGLRHAALAQLFGREITSNSDLTDAEVKYCLSRWEDWQSPFTPSAAAKKEINDLAAAYQERHSQLKFEM